MCIDQYGKKPYTCTCDKPFNVINNNYFVDLQSGWICPKCNRVYSPYVHECKCCNLYITSMGNES